MRRTLRTKSAWRNPYGRVECLHHGVHCVARDEVEQVPAERVGLRLRPGSVGAVDSDRRIRGCGVRVRQRELEVRDLRARGPTWCSVLVVEQEGTGGAQARGAEESPPFASLTAVASSLSGRTDGACSGSPAFLRASSGSMSKLFLIERGTFYMDYIIGFWITAGIFVFFIVNIVR